MCGIICVFGNKLPSATNTLKHRGPDDFNTMKNEKCYMEFSRLSINDISESGMQPFCENGGMLVCNGEIYNHKDIEEREITIGESDCECLISSIQKYGITQTVDKIRGVFALCYADNDKMYAARDPIGVRPLFYTRFDGGIAMASEMKALMEYNTKIEIFPPGHFYDSTTDKFTCYYNLNWKLSDKNIKNPCKHIKTEFIRAVKRRVENTERESAFLLSGGLDSSLVCAVASKMKDKINTFSIGMENSPDGEAAKKVAEYLDTNHTHVNFDITEGIRSIEDVIKSLETYDPTTIRASTPMWILLKYISEKTDYKVIMSGEGSDELFGGYLYFHNAPSTKEFHEETIRLLKQLHQYDVLRSDRCAAAHGLEIRVPFLDRDFIDCVMGKIDQTLKYKKGIVEKWILRKTFKNELPEDILWRQKDAFSDAVGYSWIGEIKEHAEYLINDEEFEVIKNKANGVNVPLTKEEAMYRKIFWKHFGNNDHILDTVWRPKWTNETDPSAQYLKNKSI